MKDLELISGIEQVYMELTEEYWEEKGFEGLYLKKRDGIFTEAITVWLMIWQKLLAENSMAAALQDFQRKVENQTQAGVLDWIKESKKVKFKGLSGNTGGLSQARSRLPLTTVKEIADEIYERISKERGTKNLWRGKKVYLIDGSTLAFINTPELRKAFPPQVSPNGACFPIARIVVAHDLMNGIALRPEIGTQHDSEQALGIKMMPRMAKGSVVIGDRNFGIFSIVYHAEENGLIAVLRMQKERVGKLIGHKNLDKDGEYEVEWSPSKDDRQTNPDIPKEAVIRGRVVVVTSTRNGFRPQRFYFFTTLQGVSPADLIELYGDRWFVETDLRSIKYCVDLETITVKDPDMARKEIILGISAYNLIRAITARGAEELGIDPRKISFSRAAMLIKATAELLIHSASNKERQEIQKRFLKHLSQIKLPNRKTERVEPRLVVRKKKSFKALGSSRDKARAKLIKDLS